MSISTDYYFKQPFLDVKTQVIWLLIDIVDVTSLLRKKKNTTTYAKLYNNETNQIIRVKLAELDSNFTPFQTEMFDEILKLNKLFQEKTAHPARPED